VRRPWYWMSLVTALASALTNTSGAGADERVEAQRRQMVDDIAAIARSTASDTGRATFAERVMAAMRKVERHRFVPGATASQAYRDSPLPIGSGQTISQPYIVALSTDLIDPKPDHVVLEIGTGSGYQAAVLAELVKNVYSIEIVASLGREAAERLAKLGYRNVEVRIGDGYKGWPEKAPFDGIVVTAAPPQIPQPLLEQLKVGGRLVVPVGVDVQQLVRITRTETGFREERLVPVRFVPMTGEVQN